MGFFGSAPRGSPLYAALLGLCVAVALGSGLGLGGLGCTEPAAEAPPAPPGGGGGSGGEPGCADLSATGSCNSQRPGVCAEGEVCSLPRSRSCGASHCCTLGFECSPVVGRRPGGYRCDTDEQCAAGVCLAVSGVGLCLRPCEPAATGSSCPEGLDCVVVGISGTASVHACIGSDAGTIAPEQALCANDGDCAEGRYCRIVGAAEFWTGTAHGLCVVGSRTGETGLPCERNTPSNIPYSPEHFSDLCPEGGLCRTACDGSDPDSCACRTPEAGTCRGASCTQPCAGDTDCPDRLVCRSADVNAMTNPDPDLAFAHCLLPDYNTTDWGCFDETDCCKGFVLHSGRECCNLNNGLCNVEPDETTYCRVEVQGSRFLSTCQLPLGLGALGSPCTAPAECESALCGPDGSCVSPCMAGLRDRCAEILPGSSCCPFPVGEACVPACRLDCAAGPSCP